MFSYVFQNEILSFFFFKSHTYNVKQKFCTDGNDIIVAIRAENQLL